MWCAIERGACWPGFISARCDNNPVRKSDMMEAIYASGKYGDQKVNFTGTEGSTGRLMNNSNTRTILNNWKPKYASFKVLIALFSPQYLGDGLGEFVVSWTCFMSNRMASVAQECTAVLYVYLELQPHFFFFFFFFFLL